MLLGKVIDGYAYWVCSECGAKTMMLQRYFDHEMRTDMIQSDDYNIDNAKAFQIKHSLCKKEVVQIKLDLK